MEQSAQPGRKVQTEPIPGRRPSATDYWSLVTGAGSSLVRGPSFLTVLLAGLLLWLASMVHSFGTEPTGSLRAVVSTNYVVVTNVVLVTNYVTISNSTAASTLQRSNSPTSALPDLGWLPPEDTFDWIQLKSGEWLKGKIKAMQNREIEFDSDELDIQTFDWKDIRQMRSPRILDILFLDGEKVSGPVTVTPDEVKVGGAVPRTYPRGQILGLTPGGSRELNYWSGKASLGLTVRAGNTEQVEYNAQARFQRRTPATRLSLDYLGNYSSTEGVENANNHRANVEFDLWLSRRFYLLLPFAQYYQDTFKNLAHQATVGLGAGYDLVDHPSLEWDITAGPAYQQSWFESTQPGQPTQKGTAALAFNTKFDWDITSHIELILEYRGIFTSREAGETTHHAVGTLSLELTKRLDLDVSFIWDRITNPTVGADGVQPKPDDFRLVLGLGIDF